MLHLASRCAALALTAAMIGCAGSAPPEPGDGSLRTDRGEYALQRSGELLKTTITLTYVNRTNGVVYIPGCKGPNPPTLEKWVDGRWVRAYAPVVPLCLGPPTEIAAGATYEFAYEVVAGRANSNFNPQFEVSPISGTYRAVWGLFTRRAADGSVSDPLPESSGVSNSFEIRE